MTPILTASTVQTLIREGLPSAQAFSVLEVGPGRARCRMQIDPQMRRPGGTVSGPTLFGTADAAMYAVIIAHLGAELLAVTTDATIHFLRKPQLVDVIAEARLLKLGKRLAVVNVELFSDGDPALVAHATGTYSIPVRA